VLRDLGLTQSQSISEVANGGLVSTEGVKERTAADIRNSVERISRRRCAGQGEIIRPYRYMSSGWSKELETNPADDRSRSGHGAVPLRRPGAHKRMPPFEARARALMTEMFYWHVP
jgi:hypothetical protein